VSAPLDFDSFCSINLLASSFGIVSNASVFQLTFVEGLRIPGRSNKDHTGWLESHLTAIKALGTELFTDPSVTIKSLHTMPTANDEETLLVVADVFLAACANGAVQKMLSTLNFFALPQFPLHIVIGACQTKYASDILARANRQFIGLSFEVDASSLSVLPPPLDESEEECAKDKRSHSTETMNNLNKALMESAGSRLLSPCNQTGHPAESERRTQDQNDDVDSLKMEVKQRTAKIESLCSKVTLIDREIEERGLA